MPKRKRGRPKVIIDWQEVGAMFEANSFAVDVARYIGCDDETLSKRCIKDLGITLSEYRQRCKAKGDVRLRAKQYDLALDGDRTMLIWLGKQRLNQTDKHETQMLDKDGNPLSLQPIINIHFEKPPHEENK